jgi:predicted nicotinamide N-methyase/sugar/nucleoside kinase (ribokinase family)
VPTLEETIAFIRERTAPAPVPFVPEIRLFQATELTPLWHATTAELHSWDDSPYWAFAWAGGQALARHVLDHPELVRGRRVVDFAAASGLVGIAAALAGAAEVVAIDVDPFCRAAVLLNAELNGVSLAFREGSPLDAPLPDVDVVLAGDVFYERALAAGAVAWFRALAARGVLVLAGDAWRTYAPADGVVQVAAHDVPTTVEIENAPIRPARVLRFDASADRRTALVVGHVTLDVLGGERLPGGTAYYAAHALAALGVRVSVLSAAGPDFPRDALRLPEAAPPPGGGPRGALEALVLPAPATTLFENAYGPGGVRSQRVLAGAAPLDPSRLPGGWRGPDVLLLAPVLAEVDPAPFVAAARARVAGLCVQGLVRAVGAGGAVAPRRLEPDAAALAGVTAAFVGEDEAAGQPDLVPRLAALVPIVVFTHGAAGCEVIAGGRTRRVGIHAAREVDPTGAGDVFAAAFLLGLAEGGEPVEAARLGAAAASIVVEGRGGEALPRVGEARERARRVPVEP